MKTPLFYFASACLAATLASAQMVPNRYFVELTGDSAVTSMLRQGHLSKNVRRAAAKPELRARRVQVHAGQNSARAAVAGLGGQVLDCLDTVKNALI
ncbi:MAG: hypothetical protein ACRETL_13455, partial [Gammaproteobacteria bacterium]